MLRNFLVTSWRNLTKNRVYSLINILGLAAGMAVALLIGLWMADELSFDHYFPRHQRIAQAMNTQTINGEVKTGNTMSLAAGLEMRDKWTAEFRSVSLASWNLTHILGQGEVKITQEGMFVQPAFADIFSLKMIEGDRGTLNDPSSLLLNASTAKALFGGQDPLGKTVRVDNQYDMKVAGVFEDFPVNTTFARTHLLMPWARYVALEPDGFARWQTQWDNHSWQVFAELNPGVDMARTSAALGPVVRQHRADLKEDLLLQPMDNWHLYNEFKNGVIVGGRIEFVRMFGLIGGFVLLLACINFMNLSTARSERRAREVGVRKTLGSLRSQLVAQLYTESILVAFIALAFAFVFVRLSLPFFNTLSGKAMTLPFGDARFWALTLGFALFTGLVSGSYPALYLSSFKPIRVLKGTFKTGRGAALPRKVLVVVQFTVSVALIIGTIIVFRQIQYARNRSTGYEQAGLIVIKMSTPDIHGRYDALRSDLIRTGVVADMAESNSSTTHIVSSQSGFTWEGMDPHTKPELAYVSVTHDYGHTVQWQIAEGRDFSRSFPTDTGAMILNESAVKQMGLRLGMTLHKDGQDHRVIGIVRDMVMGSPYTPVAPTVYFLDYDWTESLLLRLDKPLPEALPRVAAVLARYNPGAPFDYHLVDDDYALKFSDEKRIGNLACVFAALAIFISCLGLFGLAGFVAEQRTKEMGVRKVLGASVFHLWKLQSSEFIFLVLLSCLIAMPLAGFYLQRWLEGYAYHTPLPGWVFGIAALGALVITVVTVSVQSVRAALANPVRSLRTE
ncbi:ABC transporter permease [Dinghuibacter silviterrae]|uniref:FtsX-like permease family protein n=1 Tax=Dinghuibacter silviterrae TaxID=1539049 RepID=A0A4R8DSM2_9BACT|nr:ABC transporter permease [Dinghuibacter silviterrae]TDX01264.1 FtsX-like permease family protein [Dinghuibacter silviterrae]